MPGPWQSNEERLVDEALESQLVPSGELAALGPPLPQIVLFPPREGYGDPVERTPTIYDALGARRDPMERRDFSGGPGSYSGSTVSAG